MATEDVYKQTYRLPISQRYDENTATNTQQSEMRQQQVLTVVQVVQYWYIPPLSLKLLCPVFEKYLERLKQLLS